MSIYVILGTYRPIGKTLASALSRFCRSPRTPPPAAPSLWHEVAPADQGLGESHGRGHPAGHRRSSPPKASYASYILIYDHDGGITTALATKLCPCLFQLPLQQTPRLHNTKFRSGPLCTGSAPPLGPRARRSWYEEQKLRQSGSLYA
jgi:hypothetical protein